MVFFIYKSNYRAKMKYLCYTFTWMRGLGSRLCAYSYCPNFTFYFLASHSYGRHCERRSTVYANTQILLEGLVPKNRSMVSPGRIGGAGCLTGGWWNYQNDLDTLAFTDGQQFDGRLSFRVK